MTTRQPWYTKLEKLGACSEAVEYAKTQPSCAAAWRNCERGDWMLWVLGRNGTDRKKLVLAAVACARPALKYTKDPRVMACLDTVAMWCRGKATIEQVIEARNAADAAVAAAAYADAAAAAAYAAAAAAAAYAAYAAASAAASAGASAAAAAAYAAYDARKKSQKHSAGIIRKMFQSIRIR